MRSKIFICGWQCTSVEFGKVYKRIKLKINVDKSEVIRCTPLRDREALRVRLNGEESEEVNKLKRFGG